MAIAPETHFGPYRVLEKIGSGGMGEVYRGRDTRLNRDVALKVLLSGVAADPERLRRFEQEAQTLAALNHPNILAVHDFGVAQVDGVSSTYLVSEFLEGETLRDKLESGPLAPRKAVECALGIAQGLAAGHGKGIVHRDIKPENIFLTGDGRVKVLDFGLAKLAENGAGVAEQTAHGLTSAGAGTTPGMILGTVGYMSPEQVRGQTATAASDIFSLGAVLYEMVTGRRAFQRDTAVETMTAVLREEPPELASGEWHGPAGLRRITERCLEKNPQQRFQSASDLAFALESLSGSAITGDSGASSGSSAAGSSAAGTVPVASSPDLRSSWRSWWLAIPLVLLFAAAGWWLGHHMSALPAAPSYRQITFQRGFIPNARFTKDGQTVLYAGQFDADAMQMYSLRLNLLQPVKTPLPMAALFSVASTDQMAVGLDPVLAGHFLLGQLAEASINGGTPRAMEDRVISADYAPDGNSIAASRVSQGKCVLEYPAGKKLFESDGYIDHVRVSPDGKNVAFDEHPLPGDDRGFVSIVDSNGKERRLTEEFDAAQGVAWYGAGEVWFTAIKGDLSTLYGVTVGARPGSGGKLRTILGTPIAGRLQDIAEDGKVLLSMDSENLSITAVDASGKETPHLELYNGSILTDLQPDGKALLYHEYAGPVGTLYKVVYRKTDGSPPLQLGPGALPVLSPDGKTVAAVLQSSPPQAVLYPIGVGQPKTLPLGNLTAVRGMLWFPDNRHVALFGAAPGQGRRTWVLDFETGELKPFGPEGMELEAVSPDGKTAVAYLGGDVVMDTATLQSRPMKGLKRGDFIQNFTPDGKALIVTGHEGGALTAFRFDLATGQRTLLKSVELKEKAGVWASNLLLAADGKSYASWQAATMSTLYVVDGLR